MNTVKSIYTSIIIFFVSYLACIAQSTPWSGSRPDGHAPIGVMGDHTHGKNEVMFSYRFMLMNMEEMRSGTNDQTPEQVLDNYMVTPLNMKMGMHMLGAMYATSDKLTFMVMLNYLSNSMDHQTRMGGTFTTASSGIGDTKISALIRILNENKKQLHFNIGLSLPTGSIEHMDVTPASEPNKTLLPYPMRTSSGSYELLPGFTYLYQWDKLSWGSQATSSIRLNENNRGYKIGNSLKLNTWIAYVISEWLSGSVRAVYQYQGEMQGSDEAFGNLMMVPTVDPANTGGSNLSLGAGFNFYVPNGALKNFRLGIEYEKPVMQDFNGVQLQTSGIINAGVQYAF